MKQDLLILGGAGFVGSSLAIGLKQRHPQLAITCLDNLSRHGSEHNLQRLQQSAIHFVHGDVRVAGDLDARALAADTIIDCSAEPSVLAGYNSPNHVTQTNLVGTINALELARQCGARLLFLSTSRVYPVPGLQKIRLEDTSTRFTIAPGQNQPGISPRGIAEDFPLQGHRTLYGATKLASELLIAEYQQAYNMPAIINRCGIICGPWQMGRSDQGVFVFWLGCHHLRLPLKYIGFGGTGHQVRDLLDIEDLLALVDLQLARFESFDGGVFNVGGGLSHSLSLREATQLCASVTGQRIEVAAEPAPRPGDIPLYITDATRVSQIAGWTPQVSIEQTFERIHRWMLDHPDVVGSLFHQPTRSPQPAARVVT